MGICFRWIFASSQYGFMVKAANDFALVVAFSGVSAMREHRRLGMVLRGAWGDLSPQRGGKA